MNLTTRRIYHGIANAISEGRDLHGALLRVLLDGSASARHADILLTMLYLMCVKAYGIQGCHLWGVSAKRLSLLQISVFSLSFIGQHYLA